MNACENARKENKLFSCFSSGLGSFGWGSRSKINIFQTISLQNQTEELSWKPKPKAGGTFLYGTWLDIIFLLMYFFYFSGGSGEGDDAETVFAEAVAAWGR